MLRCQHTPVFEHLLRLFASLVHDEQLGLLPFKMSDLSEFRNVRTLAPGAAVIVADGDETTGFEASPFMIVGMIGSTAATPEDRGRFAQQVATSIPGVRDGRITMSEPVPAVI